MKASVKFTRPALHVRCCASAALNQSWNDTWGDDWSTSTTQRQMEAPHFWPTFDDGIPELGCLPSLQDFNAVQSVWTVRGQIYEQHVHDNVTSAHVWKTKRRDKRLHEIHKVIPSSSIPFRGCCLSLTKKQQSQTVLTILEDQISSILELFLKRARSSRRVPKHLMNQANSLMNFACLIKEQFSVMATTNEGC